MVTTLPQATIQRMSPQDREKYDNLPDEVDEEEGHQVGENGLCETLEQALATPAADGVRYHTEEIVGTGLKFRFKSLNTEDWLSLNDSDVHILEASVCDKNGRNYIDADGLDRIKKAWDARSFAHMTLVANQHCFAGQTLEGLREAAAKNSPKTDTTSTS